MKCVIVDGSPRISASFADLIGEKIAGELKLNWGLIFKTKFIVMNFINFMAFWPDFPMMLDLLCELVYDVAHSKSHIRLVYDIAHSKTICIRELVYDVYI